MFFVVGSGPTYQRVWVDADNLALVESDLKIMAKAFGDVYGKRSVWIRFLEPLGLSDEEGSPKEVSHTRTSCPPQLELKSFR